MNQLTKYSQERKKRPEIDISTMMYGKVPPQAKELEEAVIGAIMLEKSAFDRVSEILRAECFYVDAHQRLFKAFEKLASQSKVIDLLTVVEELKASEELEMVGGPYGITRLTNNVVSTAALEQHSRIILQKHILRELIKVGGEIVVNAYEETTDTLDLFDDFEKKLFEISNHFIKRDFVDAPTAVAKALNRIDTLRSNDEIMSGVPSGYSSLDQLTFGWQSQDFIILAARPSVGKTAFALNLARNAVLNHFKPVPVGFFSLEMSTPQLVNRILSAESGIALELISRGRMSDTEYVTLGNKGVAKMEKMKMYFDDTASLNIFEFRAKARRMVNKFGVGMIIIDYLQLMNSVDKRGNREQEISNISRNLKILAKELNIPIIALSQLSRAVESRNEKTPQLSDLRESGAIEQDADIVMFLYRPEYHGQNNNEMGESTKGYTELKVAKNRSGSLDTLKFHAQLHLQKFTEWSGPDLSNNSKFIPVKGSAGNFDDGFNTNEPF